MQPYLFPNNFIFNSDNIIISIIDKISSIDNDIKKLFLHPSIYFTVLKKNIGVSKSFICSHTDSLTLENIPTIMLLPDKL